MQQLPIDLPPSDDELLGKTTCGYDGCTKMFNLSDAIIGVMHYRGEVHEEHFCSNRCRDKWRDEHTEYRPIICHDH